MTDDRLDVAVDIIANNLISRAIDKAIALQEVRDRLDENGVDDDAIERIIHRIQAIQYDLDPADVQVAAAWDYLDNRS